MQEQTLIARPSNTVIITGIVTAFLFPQVLSILIKNLPLSYPDKAFYSRFIYWAEVGLLWLFAHRLEHQNLLIRTEKQSGLKFIFSAVIILYLLSLAAAIIAAIPSFFGWHENMFIFKQIALVVKHRPVLIVFIALTAGVTEEIIFRAYILTRLSALFKNKYIPVIISAILFAGLHYKYHSPREYIFTFLIGIIMGLHYQKHGNIKPLIIVHFIIDVVGLTLIQHIK